MRITIIGNCGSGKTILAEKISTTWGVPHMQLDRLWFEAGGSAVSKHDEEGRKKVRAEILVRVKDCIQQDAWVSDGWYSRVQPYIADRADMIVFLDIPLLRRMWNHLYRVFFEKRHPELSRIDDLLFLKEIVRRTYTHGKAMQEFVDAHVEKVTRLSSYREVDTFLESLKRGKVLVGNSHV